MNKSVKIRTGVATLLVGGGVAAGLLIAGHSTPAPAPVVVQKVAAVTTPERVSDLTYSMCMAVINGTRAQMLATPKDQRTELLAVENWCNALAIRTNHNG